MVRSTSSTPSGSSATKCRLASMAARKLGNWQMPTILRGRIGCSCNSSAAEKASVPSLPTSSRARFSRPLAAGARGQHLDIVAPDPAQLVGEAGGDLVGLGRTQGAQALHQAGDGGRHLAQIVGDGAEAVRACHRPGWRRWRAHCPPSSRSGSIWRRTSCWPPCRRWCSAPGSRGRPGRTSRAASAPRSVGRARCRAAPSPVSPSTLSTVRRCLLQSSTMARLTVCPHWLVPPPRGSTGTPASRATASTACTSATVFGTTTPSGCTW